MLSILPFLFYFVLGLVILYAGAEGTLHGSVSIARRIGISQLVIGLTLVAFGTSAPELSLDVSAAFQGSTDLALGDLVGSNIANIGLILGVAAILRPVRVHMRLLRAEVPILLSASLVLYAMAFDGELSRQDGLIMLAMFVLFLGYSYRAARRESARVQQEFKEAATEKSSMWKSSLLVISGLTGLVVGAQLMVYAAVRMAELMGVSELIIGLTIVAVGTSLPELATSIVASRRNEADIVVGNVIGSNIFNILFILALVAVISPIPVRPESLRVDMPVMVGFVVLLAPIMLRGMVVSRAEGIFLVTGYVAFLAWQLFATLGAAG